MNRGQHYFQRMRSLNGDVFMLPTQTVEPPTFFGIGQLTWLSSKAGVLTCKGTKKTVSFQIKDFCDQGVTDLTTVLCVGFTLRFQAAVSESNDWIATSVAPLQGIDSENEFFESGEVDLEAAQAALYSGPPRSAKDTYSVKLEAKAIPLLLSVFQRQGAPQCQLSSLHSHICNCGDTELFHYIGTSSLKRRQYIEKRTHLFDEIRGDQVRLQPPYVYQTVINLARYLLCRGGATSAQSLFEYFASSNEFSEAKQIYGDNRTAFFQLIDSHSWIFALFPSRIYVSVRRNLPPFNYGDYVKQNFPRYDPRRRISPSPMLTPLTTSAVIPPIMRPSAGSVAPESLPVTRMLPLQSSHQSLNSFTMNMRDQFRSNRSSGVTTPSTVGGWNDMLAALPVSNSYPTIPMTSVFTSVPVTNGLNSLPFSNGFGRESVFSAQWPSTNSYSSSSSPSMWGNSTQTDNTWKCLVDSSTQTDTVMVDRGCGTDDVDIANIINVSNPNRTLPAPINRPSSSTSILSRLDGGNASVRSSSSTSVISPTEDLHSLSSGTPTTVESSPEHEVRHYDPFRTEFFWNPIMNV